MVRPLYSRPTTTSYNDISQYIDKIDVSLPIDNCSSIPTPCEPCSSSTECMQNSTGTAILPDFNAPCTVGETFKYWTCDCCTPGSPPCFEVNCLCEDVGGQGAWFCSGSVGAGAFVSFAECATSPCLSDLDCDPLL